MPKITAATSHLAVRAKLAIGLTLALGAVAALPSPALASHSQIAIIQDGSDLGNAPAAMAQFRMLGANTVRVVVWWYLLAPHPGSTHRPRHFNATDPNAYSNRDWAPYDSIVQAAAADGMSVDLTVSGGAPRWAEASKPPHTPHTTPGAIAWRPNAKQYGEFVQAVGKRYSGHFTPRGASSPLPRVHFWALFNEPNFGEDLGPQATHGSRVATAPAMYRALAGAGWRGLRASGHRHDTILIGELAAQGEEPSRPTRHAPQGYPGNLGQTRPLLFIRDLYCVSSSFRPLRGAAARAAGCPTSRGAQRRFRRDNPALFGASGFADHPYAPKGASPVSRAGNKPDMALFPDLGELGRTLDRANRAYGSHKRLGIYNTEYGYITRPPAARGFASPATAAYYINWAEYLSWRQRRIGSYMQYLLSDTKSGVYANFASGLEFSNGKPKATYDAYRLPVYMPHTRFSRNSNVELWGDARPAPFMVADGNGPQTVSIQLNKRTIKTVTIKRSGFASGYFDIHMRFPHSGSVRLAYTYPKADSFLPSSSLGQTVYSRSFNINVR